MGVCHDIMRNDRDRTMGHSMSVTRTPGSCTHVQCQRDELLRQLLRDANQTPSLNRFPPSRYTFARWRPARSARRSACSVTDVPGVPNETSIDGAVASATRSATPMPPTSCPLLSPMPAMPPRLDPPNAAAGGHRQACAPRPRREDGAGINRQSRAGEAVRGVPTALCMTNSL